METIAELSYLLVLHTVCDANEVNEEADMWLFQYWIHDTVKAVIRGLKYQAGYQKNRKLRKNFQVANWFLGKKVLDDVISEKEQEMVRFYEPEIRGEI